jgi:hypothetical protein
MFWPLNNMHPVVIPASFHRDLGLPAGLPVSGFHLYIFFTTLVSGILFMCPNQSKRILLSVNHRRAYKSNTIKGKTETISVAATL